MIIENTITINAAPAKVWAALTNPALMKKWMAETAISIITNWKVGHPITIQGGWYKTRFENKGTVLQYERERLLEYSHLSSLSKLPDKIENYTVLAFSLTPSAEQTTLTFTAHNFPTDTIYKHIAFYWNGALGLMKKQVEQ